ncbi:MAG TPA: STAS domain-containing protein [Gammaproteobacteria bacterium]|nr:STAS domain-containing protein [Gammaproteobacteria bacterium]
MADDFTQIDCGTTLDIACVAAFCMQCLAALEVKQKIVLQASELERVDTAALQVLVSLFQGARLQRQAVQWQSPSEALYQSAALLGLSDLLDLQDSGD